MPTVIDSLVVTLGLDAAKFKTGQKEAETALRQTTSSAARAAKDMEASGAQAAEFFGQIKTEALGLIGVLVGGIGLKDLIAGATNSMAGLGREARNIGVSVPALSAFSNVIERNGGSAESARQSLFGLAQQIEDFKVRGDAHILKFLAPIGADINESPLGIFMKFMKFAQEHAKDPKLVNLIGHGLGFDQGTINAVEQLKTLAEYQREYNQALRDAPTQKQADEAAQLQKAWYALQQTAKGLRNELVTDLTPALIGAAKGTRDWVEANKDWIGADISARVHVLGDDMAYASKMGQDWQSSAVTVAAYFAGPFAIAVMAGLGPVLATVVAIGAAIALLDKSRTGLNPASFPVGSPLWAGISPREQSNYVNSPRSQAFLHPAGGNPNPFQWYNPGSWLDRSKTTALSSAQAAENRETATKYFLSQGYTPQQTAGLLANIQAESSFNAGAVNGSHYGLFQWDAARSAQFAKIFGHEIHSSTVNEQLQFAQWELTHTEKASGNALRQAKTRYAAGEVISLDYERAPGGVLTGQYRGNLAQQYLRSPEAPRPAAVGAPSTTEVHIGSITVNSKATDAKGVAKDLRSAITTQANRGLN